MKVPERENDQAGDDEDGGKSNKDVVTGVPPPSIVEHLSRLWRQERLFNNIELYYYNNIDAIPEFSTRRQ